MIIGAGRSAADGQRDVVGQGGYKPIDSFMRQQSADEDDAIARRRIVFGGSKPFGVNASFDDDDRRTHLGIKQCAKVRISDDPIRQVDRSQASPQGTRIAAVIGRANRFPLLTRNEKGDFGTTRVRLMNMNKIGARDRLRQVPRDDVERILWRSSRQEDSQGHAGRNLANGSARAKGNEFDLEPTLRRERRSARNIHRIAFAAADVGTFIKIKRSDISDCF